MLPGSNALPTDTPPSPPHRSGDRNLPMVVKALDGLLEGSVIGGFSRVGYLVRRVVEGWADPPRADGKVVVVTGASSGIGRAAALALGRLGARVWVLGRDERRTEAAALAIRSSGGEAEVGLVDVADGVSVSAFAERFASSHGHLDALVHCAGALLRDYAVTDDGIEMTVATHVLGPYRLTLQLASLLQAGNDPTIVTVSSGGMYGERFDLSRLEMPRQAYDGMRAYARAKRAQVVLAAEWSRRWGPLGVASYSMHPGWVDTPGLTSGLPFFRLGPLLRTAEEGADTAVWLAAGAARGRVGTRPTSPGGFWHDRHRRGEYYLPWTRPRGADDEQGPMLWEWCATRAGLENHP